MSYSYRSPRAHGRTRGLMVLCLTLAGSSAFAVAAGPASASSARRPSPTPLQADLDGLVAIGVPGAMLFTRDGTRTTRVVSGYGELATATPMRPDDHFKIASLTKTYTATAMLQLVQRGRVRLTDNVERWLPGLVPNGRNITVRHLLSHTSGLFDYEADPRFIAPYLAGDLGFYWAPRELIALANSHPPLFPPGETDIAVYSNTNYVLAGLIIEAATERELSDVFRHQLFGPLRLRETSYQTEPGMPVPYAHGYLQLGAPPSLDVTAISPSLTHAAGAIVSTAEDVADFYRALLSGRILSRALLREMKTTLSEGTRVDIAGQRYGLGLESFPTSCGRLAWGHNGVIPGYLTFIFSSTDGERQALLMVNHDATTAPPATGPAFFALIDKAFCTIGASHHGSDDTA